MKNKIRLTPKVKIENKFRIKKLGKISRFEVNEDDLIIVSPDTHNSEQTVGNMIADVRFYHHGNE